MGLAHRCFPFVPTFCLCLCLVFSSGHNLNGPAANPRAWDSTDAGNAIAARRGSWAPAAGSSLGAVVPDGLRASASIPRTIGLRNTSGTNGLCLDVPGGVTAKGDLIDVWECNGHTNQLWLFDEGAWKIQYAGDPTKCLDAGDMKPGTYIQIWDCNGLPQQQLGYDWKAGTIYLKNSSADATLCLDALSPTALGNNVQIWGCNDYPQQLFDVKWGTTIRVNQNYLSCLDLSGGDPTAGTVLEVWDCNGLPNQQWIFDQTTGAIMFGGNGGNPAMCIDAHDMKAGNRLFIWDCNGLPAQQWGFDATMRTLYLSDSVSDATQCMDLNGGSWEKGSAVNVWACNTCWNQHWDVGGAVVYNNSATGKGTRVENVEDEDHFAGGVTLPLACPVIPAPGPTPTPGPPGTCKGGWPEFSTSQALAADPWGKYFTSLYGSVPTGAADYPMCMGDFWMFYTKSMLAYNVKHPTSVGTCPTNGGKTEGQYYVQNNLLSPPSVAWSWHPIPYQALPANSWVEVIHKKDPWGDEHIGAWFFYAKGSGIWFNLGKTVSYTDHADGYKAFKAKGNVNEDMSKKAMTAGYDSLQFLAHSDKGDYGTCRNNPGTHYLNIEIVATRLIGEFTCTSHAGTSSLLKTGWKGAGGDCVCSNLQQTLNCKGLPSAEEEELLINL